MSASLYYFSGFCAFVQMHIKRLQLKSFNVFIEQLPLSRFVQREPFLTVLLVTKKIVALTIILTSYQ